MSEPMVSTRISLAWPPLGADELTDTLVLTGRSGAFVDLRVFVRGEHTGEIDWATAGRKSWLPDSTPDQPKAMFISELDSRVVSQPASASDEPPAPDIGLFHPPLPNGDVLETGLMPNPLSDDPLTPVPYEEIWRRLPFPTGPVRATFLRSVAADGGRAFIARVGPYQLGVGWAPDENFSARRSEWVGDEWTETRCVGGEHARATLPLVPNVVVGNAGDKIELAGRVWTVLENA